MGAGAGLRAGQFFALLLACSIPVWALDELAGGRPGWLPIDLPLSAVMALLPGVIAFAMVARSGGLPVATQWFRRSLSLPKGTGWLVLAIVLYPAAMLVEYAALRLGGQILPEIALPPLTIAAMLVVFLVGAFAEELGWQGYAYPALAPRHGAAGAAILIGAFWAAWHIVPFLQTAHDARWIVAQALTMVPLRLITVWLFLRSGWSVAVAAAFHAFGNLAQFLFPRFGSHYDPLVTLAIFTAIALAVLPSVNRCAPTAARRG